jgi:NADH-quinone oxidoreductase subunit C/D
LVKISTPLSVTPTECSNWAESDLSRVTAVQPSFRTFKADVYGNIEALMNHFKLIYEGILAPPGEVYGYTEGANGELGYYVVSTGKKFPWRVKVRPPCFNIYQAFPAMIKGRLLADAVAIIGGLNVIAGELDR